MKISTLNLFLILIITSCDSQSTSNKKNTPEEKSVDNESTINSSDSYFEKIEDISQFPNDWTMLTNDYIVYKPWNADINRIQIGKENGKYILNFIWGMDDPNAHPILDFVKIDKDTYKIKVKNETTNPSQDFVFEVKIVDHKRKITLWSWKTSYYSIDEGSPHEQYFVPSLFLKNFKQINQSEEDWQKGN